MRIKELIPESWWEGLDPGFIGMMGYQPQPQQPEDQADLAQEVKMDVEKIRD
jgi:hypothetical protein